LAGYVRPAKGVNIGPASDLAHVDGGNDIVAGLRKIAGAKAPFVTYGDDSRRSKAELRFWKEAGIEL
jgi:tungstate transport system substrate-binding protein